MEHILVGSYEGSLCGFDVAEKGLKQTFGFPAHLGCVKAVAASSGIGVSAGTDETIRVCDLAKRVETGLLYKHSASVTCLDFFGTGHLISGGDDGLMVIWRVKDWEPLHSFKAHKKAICALSVHPSGRMALSSGLDKRLRMWDLIHGTCASTLDLASEARELAWAPETGKAFAALFAGEVRVTDVVGGVVERPPIKVPLASSMWFATDDCLFVGDSQGGITAVDLRPAGAHVTLFRMEAHSKRVKAILPGGPESMVTVSTDGALSVWKLTRSDESFTGPARAEDLRLAFETGGGLRVTAAASDGAYWRPAVDQGVREEKGMSESKLRKLERKKAILAAKIEGKGRPNKKKTLKNMKKEAETAAKKQARAAKHAAANAKTKKAKGPAAAKVTEAKKADDSAAPEKAPKVPEAKGAEAKRGKAKKAKGAKAKRAKAA